MMNKVIMLAMLLAAGDAVAQSAYMPQAGSRPATGPLPLRPADPVAPAVTPGQPLPVPGLSGTDPSTLYPTASPRRDAASLAHRCQAGDANACQELGATPSSPGLYVPNTR